MPLVGQGAMCGSPVAGPTATRACAFMSLLKGAMVAASLVDVRYLLHSEA